MNFKKVLLGFLGVFLLGGISFASIQTSTCTVTYTMQAGSLTDGVATLSGGTLSGTTVTGYIKDSDISGTGIVTKAGAGSYATTANNSSNWDSAYTYRVTSAGSPLGLSSNVLSISSSSASSNGYLKSTDWFIFNGKQNALGYVPAYSTTTVNGHALTSNVTVTKSDVGLTNVTNDAQVKKISSNTDNTVMRWENTTGDTPNTSLVTIDDNGSVSIPSAEAFYFGSPTVDGSWRIVRNGNNLNLERRESGSWVNKGNFLP